MMETNWVTELADLLTELSTVQTELLDVIREKRRRLVSNDQQALGETMLREEELAERLQQCHDRRNEMLMRAADRGRPAGDLATLAATLPGDQRRDVEQRIDQAKVQCRLLRHESITNWVVIQRALLHLSQMLEIIATGGQPRPTYERGEHQQQGGSLVDRAI